MRIAGALLAAATFGMLATPALAADTGWGDDIDVIVEDELDDLRGGFEVGGLNIGFGAVVTSYVNGSPVLSTQLTWTDAGQVVQQTMANVGQSIDALTPEARTALGIDGLEGAGGIVIDDEAGVTALVHSVADGSLQNIIVNSATGRDLHQDIDVTLTLPGFAQIQDSLALEYLGMRITDDMRGVAFD